MPHTMTVPIVGTYYQLPTSRILKILPFGSPLVLRPEPDNKVDPNAIAILVDLDSVETRSRREFWETYFRQQSIPYDEFCLLGLVKVGYVPAEVAKTLTHGDEDFPGRFIVLPNGKPGVQFRSKEFCSLDLRNPSSPKAPRRG